MIEVVKSIAILTKLYKKYFLNRYLAYLSASLATKKSNNSRKVFAF